METDTELKEAIEACAKIIEEKCGKKPYLVVISKANLKFDAKDKKKLTGTSSYMYFTRPPLGRNGVSKLLVNTAKMAVEHAEKDLGNGSK